MMWFSAGETEALSLSLSVAARSVAMSLPLAIVLAWTLTRRRFPGRTLLDAFVHLPLVLPPVMVGYLLLLLFGARGPVGGWLQREFGVELIFTRNGAALATAVMSFPLMVRAMRISLETDVPVIHEVVCVSTEAEARARCMGVKLNRGRDAAQAALALALAERAKGSH